MPTPATCCRGRWLPPDVARQDARRRDEALARAGRGGPQEPRTVRRTERASRDPVQPARLVPGRSRRRIQLEGLAGAARAREGATVNDVILAIGSGALRAYLAKHGELPQDTSWRSRRSTRALERQRANCRQRYLGDDGAACDRRGRAARAPASNPRVHGHAKQAKGGSGRDCGRSQSPHSGCTSTGFARLLTNERFARSQANLSSRTCRARPGRCTCGRAADAQFGMGPVTHGLGLFVSANSYDAR